MAEISVSSSQERTSSLFKFKHSFISKIFSRISSECLSERCGNIEHKSSIGEIHTVKGWVSQKRVQKNLLFIEMYDGSGPEYLQLVFEEGVLKDKIESDVSVGATIYATGKIIESPAKGQPIEMEVHDCTIYGKVQDKLTYIPAVKGASLELLRDHQDVRVKFSSIQSIFRIRSKLLEYVHNFFRMKNFKHLDPNIITTSDCEDAGENFLLTTLLGEKEVPIIGSVKKEGFQEVVSKTIEYPFEVDFIKDFFGTKAYLTVSSQLQLEALCAGMGPVYTCNPSFRAEKSKTKRHLGCFTHLEWEIPFIDLKDLMDFSEDFVTQAFMFVLKECREDLVKLSKFVSKGIIEKLSSFIEKRFNRISYDEAIDIIYSNQKKIRKAYPELKEIPKWGDDLGTYCEKYICDLLKGPTFVYNYPRDLKSFYMKQNEPYIVTYKDGSVHERITVQGCDLLIPGLGELIGSSIREDDYDKLITEMDRKTMDKKSLEWYTDLRKNARTPTGGAGVGFDRLVSVCSLIDGNIRDVVPFPVAFSECKY